MPKRKEPEPIPEEQYKRFKEAARELECDDDPEAFKAKLKKLTEAPPPESVEKRKQQKADKAVASRRQKR